MDENVTTPASYLVALMGFLSSVDWERLIYILLAIATFAINWYYKHRADKRANDKHNPDK